MKKALIIGVNKKEHTIIRLRQEFGKMKIETDFVSWSSLAFGPRVIIDGERKLDVKECGVVLFDSPSYSIIKRGKRIFFDVTNELQFLASLFLKKNMPVINGKFFIKYPFHDKFNQFHLFSQKNIPTIPTMHCVDNSFEKVRRELDFLGLSYPLVIKESNVGMGHGVYRAGSQAELKSLLRKRRNVHLIFQPYIENKCDYRVIVCGGKSLGVMRRSAVKGAWKNNFSLGGKIEKHIEPTMERFAESACRKIGLDLAGVDIFKTQERAYKIIEVNLFPCFEGFEKIHPKVNVAKKIARLAKDKGCRMKK